MSRLTLETRSPCCWFHAVFSPLPWPLHPRALWTYSLRERQTVPHVKCHVASIKTLLWDHPLLSIHKEHKWLFSFFAHSEKTIHPSHPGTPLLPTFHSCYFQDSYSTKGKRSVIFFALKGKHEFRFMWGCAVRCHSRSTLYVCSHSMIVVANLGCQLDTPGEREP